MPYCARIPDHPALFCAATFTVQLCLKHAIHIFSPDIFDVFLCSLLPCLACISSCVQCVMLCNVDVDLVDSAIGVLQCCSRSGAVPAAHGRYVDRHGDRRSDVHPAARNNARLVLTHRLTLQ